MLNTSAVSGFSTFVTVTGNLDRPSALACCSERLYSMEYVCADRNIAQRCILAAARGGIPTFDPNIVTKGRLSVSKEKCLP